MALLFFVKKLIGIFLLLFGIFMTFFFPGIQRHQLGFGSATVKFDITGIFIGIVSMIIAGYLLFYS